MEVNWKVKIYDQEGLVEDPKAYECHKIERVVLQFPLFSGRRTIEVEIPKEAVARSDALDRGAVILVDEAQCWEFTEALEAITRVKLPKEYGFDLLIAPRGFIFVEM